MKNKRGITLVLLISLCLSIIPNMTLAVDNSIILKGLYNDEFTNSVLLNQARTYDLDDKSIFNIELDSKDDSYYTAYGKISKDKKELSYSAEGELKVVKLSSGEKGIIGNLLGTIDSTKEHINITVHSIPSKDNFFALVTLGTLSNDTDILTSAYGNVFEEMTELVQAFIPKDDEKVFVTNNTGEVSIETLDGFSIEPMAAYEYNTTLRSLSVGRRSIYSGTCDLVATTFYTPFRMVPNSVYNTYVKVNSHEGNANAFARSYYGLLGTLSTWTSSGFCQIGTSDKNMKVSNLDPGNENFSISLPIPYMSSELFRVSPFSFNIGFSTIKATTSKLSGSIQDNIATWRHNYRKNMSWGSNGPVASTVGYSGLCDSSYKVNRDYDYTTKMYGKGSVSYSYQGMYGAQMYSGGFTVESPSEYVNIIIDKK